MRPTWCAAWATPTLTLNAALARETRRIQEMLDRPENGDRWGAIRKDMGDSMNRNVAVFRNEEGIQETLGDLHELRRRYENVPVQNKGKTFNTDLIFALELGYMLDCADTIAVGALERRESRGAQFRVDYPQRNDEEWLHHIVLTKGDGGPEVSELPVVITKWTPEERKY